MELGAVAVPFQLAGDKTARAVDMGEAVVKRIFKIAVNAVVHRPRFSEADGGGDVFRLHMEGGRVRNSHFLRDAQPAPGKGEGHGKMDDVRPGDRFPQGGAAGLCKGHPLGMGYRRDNGDMPLLHRVFVFRGCAGAYYAHFVAVLPEGFGKTAGGDGGAVVIVVKLIDHH